MILFGRDPSLTEFPFRNHRLISLSTRGTLSINTQAVDAIGPGASFFVAVAFAYLDFLEDQDVSICHSVNSDTRHANVRTLEGLYGCAFLIFLSGWILSGCNKYNEVRRAFACNDSIGILDIGGDVARRLNSTAHYLIFLLFLSPPFSLGK